MRTIIGVSGWSGSGKDEFANHLMKYDKDIKRLSFGDILKGEVSFWLKENKIHFEKSWLYGSQEDKQSKLKIPVSIFAQLPYNEKYGDRFFDGEYILIPCRSLMSWWCDWRRDTNGDNYFVDKAMWQIGEGITIITDLRFPNEAREIADRDGFLIRITRPNLQSMDPIDHQLDNWKYWDFEYNNNLTLSAYHEWIESTITKIYNS